MGKDLNAFVISPISAFNIEAYPEFGTGKAVLPD
jgi:hypothetical protein